MCITGRQEYAVQPAGLKVPQHTFRQHLADALSSSVRRGLARLRHNPDVLAPQTGSETIILNGDVVQQKALGQTLDLVLNGH